MKLSTQGSEGRAPVLTESDRKGWFSPTLFWKNLTRFWPLVAGYGALQFFMLPMNLLTQQAYYGGAEAAEWVADQVLEAGMWAVPMGAVFGFLAAMALFSYLMNNRSVGMLHALPIRREGLFLTNWVSGLCFFLVPNAVVTLIALGAEAYCGSVQWGLTLRWLALHTVVAMFFFCFAVCCAMFTGHILALPVFYGVLNALVAGLSMLVDHALDVLLVGYAGDALFTSTATRWCTPLWHLIQKIGEVDRVAVDAAGRVVDYVTSMGEYTWTYDWASGTAIALGYCVALGAAFTLIAVLVYQHRQLERSGDVVTVGWVRPIFQNGVGVCVGLSLGTILYENFFRGMGAWPFVALVAVCAVLGVFVARMFLKKTLRVFAEGWKGAAALGLCMLLILGGARADLFGYQRKVPQADKVESVYLWGMDSSPHDGGYSSVILTDPALVEQVTELHRELVKDLDGLEWARWNGGIWETDPVGWEIKTSTRFYVEYLMEDGTTLKRQYSNVPITREALEDPGSYAARFQALLNEPAVVREAYLNWIGEDEEATAVGGWLNTINSRDDGNDFDLTQDQAEKLWDAFLEDLDAGRLHRYLLDDRERAENCCYTDLYFSVSIDYRTLDGRRKTRSNNLCVALQRSATAMMEVLEEEGLTDLLLYRETGDQKSYYDGPVTVQVGPASTAVEIAE